MFSEAQERILSCPSLPTLPGVAVRILELTQNDDVSLRDISKVVEQDQALTGKILKTVNSSFYGLAQPCGTVDRALNYLGLTTVKSLVLGFSLVDSTRDIGESSGFTLEQYWSRTIYAATAARLLALRFRRTDPDEAFTAALFQDIGVLAAVAGLKDEYLDIVGDHLFDNELPRLEQDGLGCTHTQVGAALAEKWRLPQAYIAVIQHHHSPDRAPVSAQQVVRTAVLGSVSAEILAGGDGASAAFKRFQSLVAEWYGESVDDIGAQFDEIASAAKEVGKVFEQHISAAADTSQLVVAAHERAIEIQISSEQESTRDGLTGIANRKQFDFKAGRWFEEAKEAGTPIAILFADGDRFKSVNDTLGHQAGDAVLVELAARIREAVADAGEAFRYGGEEFAIVLPGLDLEAAAAIAERVRAAIEAEPIDLSAVDCDADTHHQTLSIGVAASLPAHPADSLTALVKAADDAVYRAKENGRNRVELAQTDKPAAPVQAQAKPAPMSAVPKLVQPSDGVRVLIVEDDPLAATLWRTMLLKTSGVEVTQATGRRGVEKLLASGYVPTVVVTDYLLGSGTAVDIVLVVRRNLGDDVPILVISAQLDPDREEAAMAAGATACVSKNDVCKKFKWWIDRVVAGDVGDKRAAG